jgi:hypothetical protein
VPGYGGIKSAKVLVHGFTDNGFNDWFQNIKNVSIIKVALFCEQQIGSSAIT